MNANANPSFKAPLRGNYVLLTADTLRLLLPQHEVIAAEYLRGTLVPGEAPGLLKLQGAASDRRFGALSSQMQLLRHCPPDRFLVTTIGEGNSSFGWCWNDMKVLIDVELEARPLPAVLLAADTPVDQYVELGGKLAYPCSAQKLYSFVQTTEMSMVESLSDG